MGAEEKSEQTRQETDIPRSLEDIRCRCKGGLSFPTEPPEEQRFIWPKVVLEGDLAPKNENEREKDKRKGERK